ncbi:MAG: CinA family protein [Spirochaetaceae bacterium]|jgi:PncC family amidohydrolase|nr:CinA family protein [Spirochaetaceae bacterium]
MNLTSNSTAKKLFEALRLRGLKIVFAESCTAGLAADALARIPGASGVLWGSYITYSEAAKQTMLGVPAHIIEQFGVVSGETAQAMAAGALEHSGADIAAAVTGFCGPTAIPGKNAVGDVWFAALARQGASLVEFRHFRGGRNGIRKAAAQALIETALRAII